MPESEAVPIREHREIFTPSQQLKMDIFSRGVRPTDSARSSIQGNEGKPLTTGDYVSTDGVILRVGNYTTINAPFPDNNPFAKDSPNVLDFLTSMQRTKASSENRLPFSSYFHDFLYGVCWGI